MKQVVAPNFNGDFVYPQAAGRFPARCELNSRRLSGSGLNEIAENSQSEGDASW
jgi:hypothetical protein